MDNYVKCFRQLSDHRIWLAEPFTRGQAFWDLVMLANHKENSFMVRGNLVTVKRGQVGRSEESWSKRWKWSRCKVRAFWSFLIQQNMIKIDRLNSRLTTIVTLLNYDKWNGDGTTEIPQNRTTDRTTERQQKNINNNVKNEKKLILSVPPPENSPAEINPDQQGRETWLTPFGIIWAKAYGGEIAYGQAGKIFKRLLLKYTQEKILTHFENYCSATDLTYASVTKFSQGFESWGRKVRQSKVSVSEGSIIGPMQFQNKGHLPAPVENANWKPPVPIEQRIEEGKQCLPQ